MAEEQVTTELEQANLPSIYEYSVQVYQQMKESSSYEVLGSQYGDEEGLVYEGFLTKLIGGMDLPTPYYTKVMKELKRMDCVRQLRRGGSSTTSRWLLMQEPTPDLFRKMGPTKETATGWKGSVEQRLNDLNTRLSRLEPPVG
jgi:hypothetical protein